MTAPRTSPVTGDLFAELRQDGTPRYARVAVAVPVEETFSYSVPEPMAHLALPGMRVRVRFRGRPTTGILVATGPAPPEGLDPRRIRPLLDCLDPRPLVPPRLLALTGWLARRYLSSWGEALRTALPGGLGGGGRRRVALTAAGREAREGDPGGGGLRARALAGLAGAGGRGLQVGELGRRLDADGVHAVVYDLARDGLVRVEDEWSAGVGGRFRRAVRPARHLDREQALESARRAPAQRRVIEVLWERGGETGVDELLEAADCSDGVVRALLDKGIAEACRVAAEARAPTWTGGADGAGTFELTPAQRRALERVDAATAAGAGETLLLHGVTGSGKTEVYLRAARRVVEGGRRALLLVPEIGLTPLLEHRARAVLGEEVAVLHSGLADGERLQAWWRVRTGGVPVVVGPRSAVFAPLEDVGLIVLDEEQDSAYKQDERPRYHGRDVALERARLEGAAVVLGSATPAVETFQRAREGAYEVLELPERVSARLLPEVAVADMREEFEESGRTLLSRRLEDGIADRLERDEQALLLLNRRGFASALLCRACGERIPCPHCDVSLTLHRQDRSLRCHYCDHRMPVPGSCPHCSAGVLHELGHGTQQLQHALERRFPRARIRRFDADETRRKGAHGRILSAFARHEIDLLVGTQMLAKGHDFPGVTLVGVVGADDSLGLPDFRAAERTFQLLTQMAGRAGRGDVPGEVVLQAFQPEHYAIRAAVDQDYEGFFRHEIRYRRRLGYPPFTGLIACVCQGKAAPEVKEEADVFAAAVRRVVAAAEGCGGSVAEGRGEGAADGRGGVAEGRGEGAADGRGGGATAGGGRRGPGARTAPAEGVRVLGPASPPLARLRGRHRLQILIAGPEARIRDALRGALAICEAGGTLPRDLRIDVDPVDLM